jgi:ribosomal protein RSM22 (predicted rRNA methylase)
MWKKGTANRSRFVIFVAYCVNRLRRGDNKMKINNAQLQKLERLLAEGGYVVRYERGNFQSGYCILEQKRVVVLNKFLQAEGRVQTLLDLIPVVKINLDDLTDESQKLHQKIMKGVIAE